MAFLALAFVVDSPDVVFNGFLRIIQSRSILITDYVALGGMGATLLNVSIVGFSSLMMLLSLGLKPTGPNIMALWLSIGFAFFGKNVFNMIPLTFGVWLFAKYRKEDFSRFCLSALLAATVSPAISEMAFMGLFSRSIEITIGVLLGFLIGFFFPAIAADSVKVHSGFNLYNMGFAGGLVATILATLFRSLGFNIVSATHWSSGNNVFFATLLYSIAFVLLVLGFLTKGDPRPNAEPATDPPAPPAPAEKLTLMERMRRNVDDYLEIHKYSGQLVTDYHQMIGNRIFINMAVLCAFSTSVVLILEADLNGPTLAGILTITGFGSLGKHLRNVAPVMMGAALSAYVNKWDPTSPSNILAILFSTGLAPIGGLFGWTWGVAAGFLHVNVATYIGDLNGGLNLYNNGFAATFVVLFLLPVITVVKKEDYFKKDNKYR